MPGHTPLVLQTTESPVERAALVQELVALIKREHNGVSLSGAADRGAHAGALHLGNLCVNFGITVTEERRVRVLFDSVLYEELRVTDSALGGEFNVELEAALVRLCARIAETAEVAAFSLSLTFSQEPQPQVEELKALLLGDVEFTMTPPKLPTLAGIREELVALQQAAKLWGAEGIYPVGRYLIWDNLRPLSDEEEEPEVAAADPAAAG